MLYALAESIDEVGLFVVVMIVLPLCLYLIMIPLSLTILIWLALKAIARRLIPSRINRDAASCPPTSE